MRRLIETTVLFLCLILMGAGVSQSQTQGSELDDERLVRLLGSTRIDELREAHEVLRRHPKESTRYLGLVAKRANHPELNLTFKMLLRLAPAEKVKELVGKSDTQQVALVNEELLRREKGVTVAVDSNTALPTGVSAPAIEMPKEEVPVLNERISANSTRTASSTLAEKQASGNTPREMEPSDAAAAVRKRTRPRDEKKRFIEHREYVEDTETGLLWQKDGDASGKKNFYQAGDYAKQLRLGRITGWRVPTAAELDTIFPAIKPPFQDTKYVETPNRQTPSENYWTSELVGEDYALLYMWNGQVHGGNNCTASRNFGWVRCVHDPLN